MPVAYWTDCVEKSVRQGESLCFLPQDYADLRQKYRKYAVSDADRFRDGEIISGCCDRADQY